MYVEVRICGHELTVDGCVLKVARSGPEIISWGAFPASDLALGMWASGVDASDSGM